MPTPRLADRIKELSHTVGTGNIRLDGAAAGFSSFGDAYANGDVLYYAVSDGTDYECGSGEYIQSGGINYISRFPHSSTNGDNLVDFDSGVKEIYVSYPGKYSVFTSYVGDFASGISFWNTNQTLEYDQNLVWNKQNDFLGVGAQNPQRALHIGGTKEYSSILVSGIELGVSGIAFSGTPIYSGGRQFEPFLRNELDATTGTDAVLSLRGVVDQRLLFLKQNAGLVFSGPPSGCGSPPCQPDYPSFRALTLDDMPDLSPSYLDKASYTNNQYLKIPTFTTFSDGNTAIGSPSISNKGVLFFAEDTNNLYISNGTVWKSGQFI